MKKLRMFKEIEFEVEHPLYLARIGQIDSGRMKKVSLNEFEVKTLPIQIVYVQYLPKYSQVPSDFAPSAYRSLYEAKVVVGKSALPEEVEALLAKARNLALVNPDPSNWKETLPKN